MNRLATFCVLLCGLCAPMAGRAQSAISEDFTGTSTSNSWYFFNGACLTASTSTSVTASPGQITSCASIKSSYYNENLVGGANGVSGSSMQLPDPAGSGALRFTNGSPGGFNQNGAIISQTPFAAGQGVQVTFKTVTYRGNSGGTGADGADGISFFLMDGSVAPNIGSFGGSLGYTCSNSNSPYVGLIGGYLGLGIDEYGNFLNQGDNTVTGYGYVPGRIGMRGAGNIAWPWLNANYPQYYPSTLTAAQQRSAVQATCKTGNLWDYSVPLVPKLATLLGLSRPVADYAVIPNAYSVLASTVKIANESALKRSSATPIFYRLKITQDGLLSFAYSFAGGAYQQVITNQSISASNGALPATLRFGFAGSTGGSTNIHEILCFKAAAADQSASGASANEKQSSKIQTGTQAYFAFYNPNDWIGRVTANGLGLDASGNVVVNSVATWDASCVLNGLAATDTCAETGATGPLAAQAFGSRIILTWSGTAGIPFRYSNLTTTQKAVITAGDVTLNTQNRVNYLRGDRSNEVNTSGVGLYRARDGILGDIVDSSPTWVGPPQSAYTASFKDRLYPSAAAPENSAVQTYQQFVTTYQTRLNVVYVGSNDGMLHGFRTGSFDSSGNFVSNSSTPNDGTEVLAYMPGYVLNAIHSTTDATVDYSNTQYGHNFFVDATPGTGDLFYNGSWHTWLVGGLGPGGKAIYVLDVTNPSSSNFQESNSGTLVVGEWTAGIATGSMSCTNVGTCGLNLGNTYGTPQIRRFHNGTWGFVIGNGLGSSTGDAGIYIMTIDPTTQTKTWYYLTANKAGTSDGIMYVTPADLDGDRITDYVYAGDVLGNVWRFDLTSSNPASWAAAAAPMFTTSSGQPITSKLVAASGFTSQGAQRMIVAFGTGQKTSITNTSPVSYVTGTQDLYGVWDWNMGNWNSLSNSTYASLTTGASGLSSPYNLTKTNLQQQTITINATNNDRDITTNAAVCWKGFTECASGNTKFGWYLDLPGTAEQVVFNPLVVGPAFVVDSTVPANNVPTSCSVSTDTGFTYAISILSGGAFTNTFPQYYDTIAAGVQTDATGSPFPVTTAAGKMFFVYQTVLNNPSSTQINLPSNVKINRMTWTELR